MVTQRKNYFLKRLSDQQIALLNKIGMEWVYTNNPDYVWEKNYKTVLEFYSKYKHLYIPISYVTEDGVRLGVWLYDRKLEYERNELSEERKRKLDKLDKTWLESINTKSSFPEQAVMFYIRKAFPSATKLSTKEISEIDIYIPELKTGIEYDGPSHNNRIKDDIKKSQACKKVGIKLIRIRDSELPIINDESYKIVLKDDTLDALDSGISTLLHHLSIFDINVCVKRDYIEIADNYIKSIDLDWYMMYAWQFLHSSLLYFNYALITQRLFEDASAKCTEESRNPLYNSIEILGWNYPANVLLNKFALEWITHISNSLDCILQYTNAALNLSLEHTV